MIYVPNLLIHYERIVRWIKVSVGLGVVLNFHNFYHIVYALNYTLVHSVNLFLKCIFGYWYSFLNICCSFFLLSLFQALWILDDLNILLDISSLSYRYLGPLVQFIFIVPSLKPALKMLSNNSSLQVIGFSVSHLLLKNIISLWFSNIKVCISVSLS